MGAVATRGLLPPIDCSYIKGKMRSSETLVGIVELQISTLCSSSYSLNLPMRTGLISPKHKDKRNLPVHSPNSSSKINNSKQTVSLKQATHSVCKG